MWSTVLEAVLHSAHQPVATGRNFTVPLALFTFFLSGFAALLYQVIWQRLLVIFSGADVFSVTIIVAAFMAGLGLGSLAGGRLADRIGARACLWGFAAAELSIGAFGLLSKQLYYDLLYLQFPWLAETPVTAASVLFASLLWPTFCMGLSLPLLARALTSNLGLTGRVIGSLYGWNTLGAASGAFVATWGLLPRLGLERSLWIAAGVSFACAAAGGALGLWRGVDGVQDAETVATTPGPTRKLLSFRGWVVAYGLAGFIALGFEITWFRLLGVMLKSTAFTFGTLLGVYLSGLGAGATLASRVVTRSQSPGASFLLLQCVAPVYAGLSTAILMASLAAGHPIKLVRYLGGYEPVDIQATVGALQNAPLANPVAVTAFYDFFVLYLVMPALLIGPPTFLMGMSFPYLQRASHADFPRLGSRLGILLAANIAGSALGAMVTGWVLLPRLGTAGTIRLFVGLGALFALPFARDLFSRRPGLAALAGLSGASVIASLVAAMPDSIRLWARLHTAAPGLVLITEDGAGLSLIKMEDSNFSGGTGVYVNGIGQSWIPYGSVHTALGALPAFIHPAPANVLIIGLGSGDTTFSAGGRADVKRLVSVEIIGAQRETLGRLALRQSYHGLTSLLSDRRVEYRTGDGRAYILQSRQRFDIIEADALRPSSAYSGNLYSREYFELLRDHLAPGGFAVTWAPTPRIQRTFASVFPHVLAFSDIYIGSSAPIHLDPDLVERRGAAARAYFEPASIDIVELLRQYLAVARPLGPDVRRDIDDLNTDTFPRDELALPF